MHSDTNLYNMLSQNLIDITLQIEAVTREGQQLIEDGRATALNVYGLRYRDGKPVLTELLAAKATCLSAMVALKGMKK